MRSLLLTWTTGLSLMVGLSSSGMAVPTVQDFDAPGTPFTLTDTPGQPALILGGGPTGDFIRLTTRDTGGTSELAFDRTHVGPSSTITADFDFRMIGEAPGVRADGFGFQLLDTSVFGTSGRGPYDNAPGPFTGFEEPNAEGSFGIGFDIFPNGENDDPNDNHLSVHFDRSRLMTVDPGFDLANGVFNHAHLEIDFSDAGAIISLTLIPDVFGTPGAAITPISSFFVPMMVAYESRVAFAARTGGLRADQDIDNINVQFSPPRSIPEPPAILFLAFGLLTYGWLQATARCRVRRSAVACTI